MPATASATTRATAPKNRADSGSSSVPPSEAYAKAPASAGWAAPVVFVLAYAVGTVALVPGAPMTALAGVLFGPLVGTGLVVIGATAGATAAFLLSRQLGRARIQRFLGPRLARADGWLERRGFAAMLGPSPAFLEAAG